MALSMRYGSASLLLHIQGDQAAISSLYANDRRKGDATELMRRTVEYADEHGLTLHLKAQQFGHPTDGPNNKQLVAFYEQFGFEVVNPLEPIKTLVRHSQNLHGT